jgi:hypothetical protein
MKYFRLFFCLLVAGLTTSWLHANRNIDLEFIYDKSITDFIGIDYDITQAIKYGNEVFHNSGLPYQLNWVNKIDRIVYDFSAYKNQDPTVMLDDLMNGAGTLGAAGQAWLGNDKNKKVIVIISTNYHKDAGTGKACDVPGSTYRYNQDKLFVWLQPKINSIGKWVLVHEVAHLFGATHCASIGGEKIEKDGNGIIINNCGIARKNISGKRTIMSKNFTGNEVIQYFSSNGEKYGGYALGDADHNNEGTLRRNIKTWMDRGTRTGTNNTYSKVAAAAYYGGGDYAVYGLSNEGYLEGIRWRGSSWTPLQGIRTPGNTQFTDLTAVSWTAGQHGVYALGQDGNLYQYWWNGTKWSDLSKEGKPTSVNLTSVASVSWAPNQYGIYSIGNDGNLYQYWWNGSKWSSFYKEGRPSSTRLKAVSAVSWAPNQYGIYSIGEDGYLYQYWWNGSKWSGFSQQGKPNSTKLKDVAAVSWAPNVYGIYAIGEDGNLYEYHWNGSKWSGFQNKGRPSNTTLKNVSAVSYAPGRIAIYAGGADGKVYQYWWNGSKWSGWSAIF